LFVRILRTKAFLNLVSIEELELGIFGIVLILEVLLSKLLEIWLFDFIDDASFGSIKDRIFVDLSL
jgi:hypothetical protein